MVIRLSSLALMDASGGALTLGRSNYTMYVPISTLIADIKEGLHGTV